MELRLPLRRCSQGGVTLLLLHGFTGSELSFTDVEPGLCRAFRVATLALPGHGLAAGWADRPVETGWDDAVEALLATLRSLDEPPLLHGYSMGARLGLAAALRAPELLRGLSLESGTAGLRAAAERAARRAADEELARFAEEQGLARFLDRWEETPLLSPLRALSPDAQGRLRRRRAQGSAAGLAWALRALGQGAQPDLWPELHRLQLPVLLLHGARDPKYTALAAQLERALPHAVRQPIDDAGHTPHLEQPDRFVQALLDFPRTIVRSQTP